MIEQTEAVDCVHIPTRPVIYESCSVTIESSVTHQGMKAIGWLRRSDYYAGPTCLWRKVWFMRSQHMHRLDASEQMAQHNRVNICCS